MKKIFSVLSVIWIFQLAGCTKDDKIVIADKKGLLINRKWQLSGILVKNANGHFINEYDSLPGFRKDDYFFFKPDSTYEFNDHLDTIPGSTSKILDAGIWKLNAGHSHLEMHSDLVNADYNPAKIIELTTNKLTLERTHPGDGSVTVITYMVY